MTKHLRIAVDGRVEPINVIGDLVASDGRSLYCTIPDDPLVVFHYPYTDDDVKSVTISKQDSAVSVDVQTAVDHRVRFLDPKRHLPATTICCASSTTTRRSGSSSTRSRWTGFSCTRKEIIRVMTRDKKAYIMHGGVILSVGLTLRLTRVFGKVPDERVVSVEVGAYTSKTVQFSYEKLLCPKRDLVFADQPEVSADVR